jgi:hypothetical protein
MKGLEATIFCFASRDQAKSKLFGAAFQSRLAMDTAGRFLHHRL